VRRVQHALGARGAVGAAIARREFESIEALVEAARDIDPDAHARALTAVGTFRPHLLLNRTGNGGALNVAQLNVTLRRYLGAEATLLGEVPEDPAMARAARVHVPVTEHSPESPAGRAFLDAARRLMSLTQRPARVPSPAATTTDADAAARPQA
jgi:MinD-like ATPase involved in chromosome partitioning or flagellar assembly